MPGCEDGRTVDAIGRPTPACTINTQGETASSYFYFFGLKKIVRLLALLALLAESSSLFKINPFGINVEDVANLNKI